MDDEELLTLINKDLNKGFRILVKTYKEPLYWHIRKIVLSHEDANDLTQNCFISIFKNLPKFKGESKLFSWMYRIATNEALGFLRKKAKTNNISIDEYQLVLSNNLAADFYFTGEEIDLKLQAAIASLPEKQKLVFNMKYFEDITYKQMSEILNNTEGGLKANYHHAVKKIKKHLKINL